MNHSFSKTAASAICCAALISFWGSAADAQQERATIDETGTYLIIPKDKLAWLVFRLEREQWLILQNEGLLEQIRSMEAFNNALKREISQREEMQKAMEASLALADGRRQNTERLSRSLGEELADRRQLDQASAAIEKGQEKEIASLRRRLTGQELVMWAVTAAGGALLLLAHL